MSNLTYNTTQPLLNTSTNWVMMLKETIAAYFIKHRLC